MKKQSILIVEDNLIIALDLESILNKTGYHVPDIVISGAEALKKAKELQPDLIIMDISLKGNMDGIETARKIHEFSSTPIVYLTGNSEMLKQANVSGPYLNKPYDEGELLDTISSLLS